MHYESLHDKAEIAAFLRADVPLNIYAIGDLDDFFWPYMQWYGWREAGELRAVALLYGAPRLPILIALSSDPEPMVELLKAVRHDLPPRFYAHCSPGVDGVFEETHRMTAHGPHFKMILRDRTKLAGYDGPDVVPLGPGEADEVQRFYETSPTNTWFDRRMLQSGQYYGCRDERKLVSVGGIHVYSPEYRVAAVGNVITHPDWRGRGLATAVTARVCQSVGETVDHIGLNVKADNAPALACYRRLGFEVAAEYGEFVVECG